MAAMLGALQRPNLLILGQTLGGRRAEDPLVLGEFGTRFGTVLARLAATGGTYCDEAIKLSSDFHWFWLYSIETGATHWDGGILLRIRRLGVRIPPSALKVLVTVLP